MKSEQIVSIEVPLERPAGFWWTAVPLVLLVIAIVGAWLLFPPMWSDALAAETQWVLAHTNAGDAGRYKGVESLAEPVTEFLASRPAVGGLSSLSLLQALVLVLSALVCVGWLIHGHDQSSRIFTPLCLSFTAVLFVGLYASWSLELGAGMAVFSAGVLLLAGGRNPGRAWLARPAWWFAWLWLALALGLNLRGAFSASMMLLMVLLVEFAKVMSAHRAFYMPEVRFHLRRLIPVLAYCGGLFAWIYTRPEAEPSIWAELLADAGSPFDAYSFALFAGLASIAGTSAAFWLRAPWRLGLLVAAVIGWCLAKVLLGEFALAELVQTPPVYLVIAMGLPWFSPLAGFSETGSSVRTLSRVVSVLMVAVSVYYFTVLARDFTKAIVVADRETEELAETMVALQGQKRIVDAGLTFWGVRPLQQPPLLPSGVRMADIERLPGLPVDRSGLLLVPAGEEGMSVYDRILKAVVQRGSKLKPSANMFPEALPVRAYLLTDEEDDW